MNLVKPFGPQIGETSLPMDVNQQLLEICLANQDDKSKRENESLFGYIEKEFDILPDIKNTVLPVIQQKVTEYFSSALTMYSEFKPFNKFDLQCVASWCNMQDVGEFNPLHTHPEELVCVIFPEANIDTSYKKYNVAKASPPPGSLVFCNQISDQRFGTNSYAVTPKTGDMYIFPGGLSHYTVPFYKEGDRRISVSCNFVITENFYSLRKLRGYQ